MANELTHPYAYDADIKDYLAPDDHRVRRNHPYKVGYQTVYLRHITNRRPHFWDPNASRSGIAGGGGPETAAHIFAKKFYKERMFFSALIQAQKVLVRFETCVLEQRLDERTPDLLAIVSECWPPFIKPGEQFIIEIHAKNAIHQNEGRAAALERIGIACIEVDLPAKAAEWKFDSRFDARSQRKQFEAYMTRVLSTPFGVRWIVPNTQPTIEESAETISLIQRSN